MRRLRRCGARSRAPPPWPTLDGGMHAPFCRTARVVEGMLRCRGRGPGPAHRDTGGPARAHDSTLLSRASRGPRPSRWVGRRQALRPGPAGVEPGPRRAGPGPLTPMTVHPTAPHTGLTAPWCGPAHSKSQMTQTGWLKFVSARAGTASCANTAPSTVHWQPGGSNLRTPSDSDSGIHPPPGQQGCFGVSPIVTKKFPRPRELVDRGFDSEGRCGLKPGPCRKRPVPTLARAETSAS